MPLDMTAKEEEEFGFNISASLILDQERVRTAKLLYKIICYCPPNLILLREREIS